MLNLYLKDKTEYSKKGREREREKGVKNQKGHKEIRKESDETEETQGRERERKREIKREREGRVESKESERTERNKKRE